MNSDWRWKLISFMVFDHDLKPGKCLGFKTSVQKTKHVFGKQNRRLIIETVFLNPDKEFHIRGLAEETGISPSTVSKIVGELEEQNIVEVKTGLKKSVTAAGTKKFNDFKRSYNLWKLAETGLIDQIQESAIPEAIILFGSYARGEDKSDSDIDIAILNGREPDIDYTEYEKKLGRRLNIHNIDTEEADQNFIETLANGMILRGYLEI